MATQPNPRPEVADMVAVHDAFRDTLGCAPSLINQVDPDDAERIALVANFYENILAFLHVHHQGEEDLVFPLLRDRCPDRLGLIERIAAQHADVIDAVAASHEGLASWSAGETAAQGRTMQSLGKLGEQVDEHFADEEQGLLPLCAEFLSLEEWGALPGHGLSHFEGDKVWSILGLIRQRMSEPQREAMLLHMPPPAVEMWTNFGEGAFTALITDMGAPLG